MPLLAETDADPAPPGAEIAVLRAADGVAVRAAYWPAEGAGCGTIVLAPGRAEFIEKYFETVRELRDRGFAVCVFDWRGQGGSQRELDNPRKGHIDDFSLYFRDLEAVREFLAGRAPKPWQGLAHSMGGAIYLAAAREGRAPFERLVLSAPLIGIHGIEAKRWPRLAAVTLGALGFGAAYIPGGGDTSAMTRPFPGNPLTSDAARYARNAATAARFPELAIGDPTIGWVAACFRQLDAFAEFDYPRRILTPTLILAAGDDTVVSTPATERFAARLKAGRALILPGARHEILMERDAIRAQFWAAFDAFVTGETGGARQEAAVTV
ncbi:MAG: alpha/beta hydrolase [Methylobacteriaceae bacterium]|nr:alpha/beta hydrolase [Methylobacteriaceae bacterium]